MKKKLLVLENSNYPAVQKQHKAELVCTDLFGENFEVYGPQALNDPHMTFDLVVACADILKSIDIVTRYLSDDGKLVLFASVKERLTVFEQQADYLLYVWSFDSIKKGDYIYDKFKNTVFSLFGIMQKTAS